MANISIREFLANYDAGMYSSPDVKTQIEAGWYDWFCRDTSLKNKTDALVSRLKAILKVDEGRKINIDTMYVFFKNNCPLDGSLYDDFRICSLETKDVIYTIAPSVGYTKTFGQSELWGKENEFKEPLVEGRWSDVKAFFKG